METDKTKPYWFYAKRYGWGWGLPATWQGWVVFVAWLGVFAPVAPLLAGSGHWIAFWIFVTAMSAGLIAICYWKGEPPRWRWGGD
jgi:hypothetical protein